MFPRGSSVLLSSIVGVLTRRSRPHSPSRPVLLRHTLPLLALLSLPFSAHAVFTTPGSFDVGPDGAAGYTIPIQVPPGTAGMAPKLSLSYNSNGGNGVLGMGWSLEGLSQIGRCPKTMAIDGVRGGINLDANDRYCIDGQRLLAAVGTYGADGTEYRSELANFAKVISYGTAGNGPAWFKVWTKGGQIIEYGNTADSRIEAQGKPTVLSWGVNKISDTKGNYLTVSYTEDNANGETLVNRIDYTGNASTTPTLTPYASVQFTYETRPDPSIAYVAGSIIKSTKRISKVTAHEGNETIKDYRLVYEALVSPSTQRSRLGSILECDSTSGCIAPTLMDWENGTIGFDLDARRYHSETTPYSWPERQLADVNGDGRADLVLWHSSSYGIYFIPGTETGFDFESKRYYSGTPFNWAERQLADVNGDGRADLVLWHSSSYGIYFIPGTETGFDFESKRYYSGTPFNWAKRQLADVNGDGRADLVLWNSSSYGIYFIPGTATGFDFESKRYYSGTPFNWAERQLADVNGDGRADLILWNSSSYGIYFIPGTATGFDFESKRYYSGTPFNWAERQLADVNGDGKADLVLWNSASTGIYFIPGTGAGFDFEARKYHSGTPFNWAERQLADVNGDGRADLILWNSSSYGIYFIPGTATGFDFESKRYYSGTPFNWAERQLADVNGDGMDDLVLWNTTSTGLYLVPAAKPYPDLLVSMTSGLGAVTTITYQPLTASEVYTKDTGSQSATYPIQDYQGPTYVVSSVSTSDGLGGTIVTNYTYGGAKADLSGRGFLGYRWTRAVSPDTNLDLTTYYRQDYPYIGLPLQSEKRTTSGVLLSAVANTYANTPVTTGSATSQFPYVSQTQEQNYELDGSLVTSTTTGYQYDDYGNATQVVVNSNDGFIKTTANLYANDVPNWLLGRLLRSSVTTTAP